MTTGPETEPVLVAVALDAEERGEQQQHQRDREARVGEPPDPAVRQPAGDPGERQAEQHPDQLATDHGVGVAVVDLVGVDAAGAEHHDQPDGEQQRGGAEQQVVRRQRPVQGGAERTEPGPRPDRGPAPPGGERVRQPRTQPGQAGRGAWASSKRRGRVPSGFAVVIRVPLPLCLSRGC